MPLGQPRLVFETLPSTNSFLLEHPEHCAQHGLVVWAQQQTAGRGRVGRSFVSPAHKTLTFSCVLHTAEPRERHPNWALWSGLALYRLLQAEAPPDLRLKWPNDLLVGPRKLAGILVETGPWQRAGLQSLVIGIGLNVNGTCEDFPEPLRARVTTLEQELKKSWALEVVLEDILRELQRLLHEVQRGTADQLLREWEQAAAIRGARVQWKGENDWRTGTVQNLDKDGFPQIAVDDGSCYRHISGDLEFLPLEES